MTTYLDKHGTTINLGDIIVCHCGSSSCEPGKEFAAKLLERPENYAKHMEVTRRADGSPVYRYKGGDDVRVGDEVSTNGVVTNVTGIRDAAAGPVVDTERVAGGKRKIGTFTIGSCTLIRRARESEQCDQQSLDGRCVKPMGHAGDHNDGYEQWGHGSICECEHCNLDRGGAPILGLDRNGKEVRRGDRVRNVHTGNILCVERAWDGDYGPGFDGTWPDGSARGVHREWAELVTDEKAEPDPDWDPNWGKKPLRHCVKCRCSIPPFVPTFAHENGSWCRQCHENYPLRPDGDPDPLPAIAYALESLCRALAQPTMGERFERFRARVDKLMRSAPYVRYDFDCDQRNGPVVRLRTPSECHDANTWYGFDEHADDKLIVSRLNAFALDIGRAVLRGGK